MPESIRDSGVNGSGTRRAGFLALLDAMLAGGDAAAVKLAKPLIDDARPEDLVAAVDAAVDRGDDFPVLKPAVSRLINLLASSLKKYALKLPADEIFFTSLLAENAGLASLLEQGKVLTRDLNTLAGAVAFDDGKFRKTLAALRDFVNELGAVEIHYRKKENVLFPWFESQYPRYRCVRLMWDIHDDVRRGLKELARILETMSSPEPGQTGWYELKAFNQVLGRLYFDLNANMFREEYALLPVVASSLSGESAERLFEQTLEYGFAFLDEQSKNRFTAGRASGRVQTETPRGVVGSPANVQSGSSQGAVDGSGIFTCATGSLPAAVLTAMFSALPVDMTWVDADDKVRWFSDSPHRIFPRSAAIIGRDVRNCHPGASVGRVVSILESFRCGEKEREAFWIAMGGRFIHIEYFALRSVDGAYLGVLEASQDITGFRALSGEKRLAD